MIDLDANVVIRLVEGDAAARAPLAARLVNSLGVKGSLVTSRLTRLECRTKPLRDGDKSTLAAFEVFFAGMELVLVEITTEVVERGHRFKSEIQPQDPGRPPLRFGHRGRSGGVLERGPGTFSVY